MTIKDAAALGQIIRQHRKRTGFTQKKMAALAGVGARFLSELERGKPTVQLGKTLKVITLLGLELTLRDRKAKDANG